MTHSVMKVPVADPRLGYIRLKKEIDRAVQGVMNRGQYILGPEVEAFEREFAAYLGTKYAVAVANGTDAIELALRAAGVGNKDMVAVPAHTAVATVAAIEHSGARPLLVDIDPATYTMDPKSLHTAMKGKASRVRAVIPVHLYGHPAQMDSILEIACSAGAIIIEDCAQAHGALWKGKRVGSQGSLAAFSFYPTKNLAALGDSGAVATNDSNFAGQLRLLRQYGWRKRYVCEFPGMNSRMDELQAAVLRIKLRHLDQDNAKRRQIAMHYAQGLSGLPIKVPITMPKAEHVYHQFVIEVEQRDALMDFLREAGIGTAVLYPVPIHLQPAYKGRLAVCGSLHHSEQVLSRILCLPMYPELIQDQVEMVCHYIKQFFQ